ncbi:MAG: hypothetical protein H6807_00700 [Planctomycetes bacterium]|nr:hypothetical protein [Planctomycetota bacterium]
MVGLVVSLVGAIFTFGLLCPLGALISMLGLGKAPRGLAIAGSVVGIAGSIFFLIMGLTMLRGLLDLGDASVSMERTGTTGGTLLEVHNQLIEHRDRTGDYPATADFPAVIGKPEDAWGQPILYRKLPRGFEVRSPGEDGIPGTEDDISIEKED